MFVTETLSLFYPIHSLILTIFCSDSLFNLKNIFDIFKTYKGKVRDILFLVFLIGYEALSILPGVFFFVLERNTNDTGWKAAAMRFLRFWKLSPKPWELSKKNVKRHNSVEFEGKY
jgi:hypothetical protein